MKNAFLCAAVVILSYGFALGQATEKLLYSFGPPPDAEYGGGSPLVSDNTGNLYGVATGGGSQNGGAVFELSPNGDGSWSETLLYSFCPYNQNCPDGSAPEGLTIDSQGNLFGITGGGGTYDRVPHSRFPRRQLRAESGVIWSSIASMTKRPIQVSR